MDDGHVGLTVEMGRSRALLTIAVRRFENQGKAPFSQKVDRLAPIQTMIRPREEAQHSPGAFNGKRILYLLETCHHTTVPVELKRWVAAPVAWAGDGKQTSFLHTLVDSLTGDPMQEHSDLLQIVGTARCI